MSERFGLVVSLWIYPVQELAFEAYEWEAAAIMARHGCRIDSAIRISPDVVPAGGKPPPFEIHVVSFPHRAASDSYASDPDIVAVRSICATIIADTERLEGRVAAPD